MARKGLKKTPQTGPRSINDWQRHRFLPSLVALEDGRLLSTFAVEDTRDNKSDAFE
jgi:hypothetical protein